MIFGGSSAERDVSIASGAEVFKVLRDRGHEVLAVDTARGLLGPTAERELLESRVKPLPPNQDELSLVRSGATDLTTSPDLSDVDVYFLALHGGAGEDGTFQAALSVAGIPFTGSSHMPSVYAMDKDISKRLFRAAGIPTPDWVMAPIDSDDVVARLGLPVIVKANKQGSTIGLTAVREVSDFEAAVANAFRHDDEVMIEKLISGRELTVGILENRALAVGEIIPQESDIFDYASKYQEGGAEEIFPADLPPVITQKAQELALKVHETLKLEDYSRVDMMLDEQGRLWCLEANTLPGLTQTSLLPQSAAAVGISFGELCERICALAIRRHSRALTGR